MVRTPSFDKNGIKKGAWNPEEDIKLEAYITRYGHWNWRELPKFAGLQRCGKSCRLRWMNYLRPNVKRGGYTHEEEDLIMELHEKHGNKWSMIAGRLPGRTDNEIKNHWHTHLKKRCASSSGKGHVSSSPAESTVSDNERSTQRHQASSSRGGGGASLLPPNPTVANDEFLQNIPILESSSLSSAATVSSSTVARSGGGITEDTMSDCFFFGPEFSPLDDLFEPNTANYCSTSIMNPELMGGELDAAIEGDHDFWTTPFTVEDMMSSYDASSFNHDYANIAESHRQLLSSYMYDQSNDDFFSY
ncbi:hypothetical protein V2J09_010830 [Rumex salicifolius]